MLLPSPASNPRISRFNIYVPVGISRLKFTFIFATPFSSVRVSGKSILNVWPARARPRDITPSDMKLPVNLYSRYSSNVKLNGRNVACAETRRSVAGVP